MHARRVSPRTVGAWLLSLVVLLGSTPAAAEDLPPGGSFLDDDRTFAEGSIEALVEAGIVHGCGPELFCPGRGLSRGEAAALLARSFPALVEGEEPGGFADVPPDAWFAEPISAVAARGLMIGHSDGTFRPGEVLTRAEMAVVLMRALRLEVTAPVGHFDDVSVGAWYAPAAESLLAAGITRGCGVDPVAFCPDRPVRRDEMAVFLTRSLGLTPITPPGRMGPLNGLPVDGLDVARRVVAVKVDNARGARPQSGVERADAMIETLVEGGLTRWIALFHQSDTGYVGPVRSGRPTDTGLLLPLGATLVASGGQPWILDAMAAQGVPILRERDVAPPALRRIPARSAPHDLYGDTASLRDAATAAGFPDVPPATPLFSWGPMPESARPATSVSLSWSDPISVEWTWDGRRYLRSLNGVPQSWIRPDGSFGHIAADVLVILVGPVYEAWPPPGVLGSPVPAIDTVGEGDVYVFARGRTVRGRWQRPSADACFAFTTPAGTPLSVPSGVPWISVFPSGRAIGG